MATGDIPKGYKAKWARTPKYVSLDRAIDIGMEIEAATIERCAQVAENTAAPGQWGTDRGAEIAAAIRAHEDIT